MTQTQTEEFRKFVCAVMAKSRGVREEKIMDDTQLSFAETDFIILQGLMRGFVTQPLVISEGVTISEMVRRVCG